MTSRIIPPYCTDGSSTAPMGLPMCQNRLAIPTWSYALEIYPPARIIEIGTYAGGFTIALALHARLISARVVTYDRMVAPREDLATLGSFLGVEFRMGDVWAAEREIAALVASPGVTYVLCDGGDKPRELATFARYLKPGDVIAAHDYHVEGSNNQWWGWGEIRLEDGAGPATAHDLEPFLQEHFDTAAWLAYRKRGSQAP